MLVANEEQTAVGATLGAKQTAAFEMVEDASFFQMLSSNLYSNQRLAVVREVMCNAWDAHIEAGKTGIPIEVKIGEDNIFSVRDFGLGIPHHLMQQVYCTYGKSTKKNDSRSTGGFGLGCKSPFALVDSFTVVNENQGKKVVYNLVKSSVEAGGLPSMSTVLTLDTEGCGLTVSMHVERSDINELLTYIRAIAMHGDMLVKLTGGRYEGEILPRINLNPVPGTYQIDRMDGNPSWHFDYMGDHRIFVRYGAVMYPMLTTPGTKRGVALLQDFMDMAGFNRIVVQAAPDTLALTPNREALSSQRMTEEGIADLCLALVDNIERDLRKMMPAAVLKAEEVIRSGKAHDTFTTRPSMWDAIHPAHLGRYIRSGLCSQYRIDQHLRARKAETAGFLRKFGSSNKKANKGLLKLRHKMQALDNGNHRSLRFSKFAVNAFARKHVMHPIGRMFAKHRHIASHKSFYALAPMYSYRMQVVRKGIEDYVFEGDYEHVKHLLDNKVVFLSPRIKDIERSAADWPQGQASRDYYWFYKMDQKQTNKAEIIRMFEGAGFTVVDLTQNFHWDNPAQKRLAEAKAKAKKLAEIAAGKIPVEQKKSVNNLFSLSNIYEKDGKHKRSVKTLQKMSYNWTTEKPLFYVEAAQAEREGYLGKFWHYNLLTDDEKQHGIMVRNGIEKNMAIKRGAVPVNRYFAGKLLAEVLSPGFRKYMEHERYAALEETYDVDEADLKLMKFLGISMPGLAKLREDKRYDIIANLVTITGCTSVSISLDGQMTSEQKTAWYEAEKYSLVPPPFLSRLKAVFDDRLLSQIEANGTSLLSYIQAVPERKAAIKSLVLIAIKNGTYKP